MDCYACQRPDTKYRCIKCANRICNICTVPSENEPEYNEKAYMVGICSKCIEYKSIDENKEECKIASSSPQKPPKKKRQQTLLTFLSNKNPPLSTVRSKVNVIDSDQPKAQNPTNTTTKSKGGGGGGGGGGVGERGIYRRTRRKVGRTVCC